MNRMKDWGKGLYKREKKKNHKKKGTATYYVPSQTCLLIRRLE